MRGLTHMAGGVVGGLILSSACSAPPVQAAVITGCSAAAALIPDIDICTSKLGSKAAPASFLIQLFIGHRTVFHSPLLYCILFGSLAYFFPEKFLFILAGVTGTATHLILDMANPAGIPLFWPIPKTYRFACAKSGGFVDWLTGVILILIAGLLVYRTYF